MQDYSQNNQTDQDKRKKRNDIQREIIMSESDLHKSTSRKLVIEAELSHLKKDIDHLRADMDEKQKQHHSIEQEIMMKQEGLTKIKKQLNLI